MQIKILSTGEIKAVNASYGARMCEQGKAIAIAKAKPEPKAKRSRKDVVERGTEGQNQE